VSALKFVMSTSEVASRFLSFSNLTPLLQHREWSLACNKLSTTVFLSRVLRDLAQPAAFSTCNIELPHHHSTQSVADVMITAPVLPMMEQSVTLDGNVYKQHFLLQGCHFVSAWSGINSSVVCAAAQKIVLLSKDETSNHVHAGIIIQFNRC